MIDTVVILLSKELYHLHEPDKFKPSAAWALTQQYKDIHTISKQNPTTKDLALGNYKPRLTLFNALTPHGMQTAMLKIELSLPKLLFGNNFLELRYKDFNSLLHKLVASLASMGISTTIDALAHAPITTIHYAKNIILTDGATPYHYIQKIKEANIKLMLDVNQTDYRNNGYSYKWHANSYEVIFYDKIMDLAKAKTSSKRAIEKDNAIQLGLLKQFQTRHRLEILRMEVRLNNSKKIKQLFKTLDIPAELTLKKLFKPAIAKKVLLHYLDELESKRPLVLDYKATNDKALIVDLILNNPHLSPQKILQLFGLKKALDIVDIRELRTFFASYNKRSWYRLMSDINKVTLPNIHNPFNVIREQLMKFEAILKV